jgi:hypothetical protein
MKGNPYMLSYGEAIAGVGSRREVGIVAWDEGLKTLEEKFWKGSLPRLR